MSALPPLISVHRIKPLIDCQSPPWLSKATREALFWNTKDIISISTGITEHPVRSGTCYFRPQCLSFITNKNGTTLLYLKQHWYMAPTEKAWLLKTFSPFAQSSSIQMCESQTKRTIKERGNPLICFPFLKSWPDRTAVQTSIFSVSISSVCLHKDRRLRHHS